MAHKVEIIQARKGAVPTVEVCRQDATDPGSSYFVDGRDGVDRWGYEQRKKWVCGSSWADACPLYVDGSCPGERQPGVRLLPNEKKTCDLRCGACGGAQRVATIGTCGQAKGLPILENILAEMGTLRLDTYQAPPAAPIPPFGVAFAPTLEWGGKKWIEALHAEHPAGHWPMVTTTMKTASPGNRKTPSLLRERLGDYRGMIAVTGLVKDDVLDDGWDNLEEVIRYGIASGVDIMCTHQFSYY